MFRSPLPQKEDHDELHASGSVEMWQNEVDGRQDWQLARDFIRRQSSIQSILDIGCFDAQFLRHLGGRYERFGVEVHPVAAEIAQTHGIAVVADDFLELAKLDQTFDAVVSMDVIEHTHNPLEFLCLAARVTRRGGFIILSTGNSEAATWNFMGSRYWYCSLAEHLCFINRPWCEHAAKAASLEVVSCTSFSHSTIASKIGRRMTFLRQSVANIVFKYAPGIWGRLRPKKGDFGDRSLPSRIGSPPSWIAARDHIFVVFKKI